MSIWSGSSRALARGLAPARCEHGESGLTGEGTRSTRGFAAHTEEGTRAARGEFARSIAVHEPPEQVTAFRGATSFFRGLPLVSPIGPINAHELSVIQQVAQRLELRPREYSALLAAPPAALVQTRP